MLILKLYFQEKNLNLDQDLNHGSPRIWIYGSGSNISLENLLCIFYKAWNL